MDKSLLNQSLAYLGKKIDELKTAVLSKDIKLDLGDSLKTISKETVRPLEQSINGLISEIQSQTRTLDKKTNADVVESLKMLRQEFNRKEFKAEISTSAIDFSPIVKGLEALLGAVNSNKPVDNKDVVTALNELRAAVKANKVVVPKVDLSKEFKSLESVMGNVLLALEAGGVRQREVYEETVDVFGKKVMEMKPKDTFKIDERQMQALMAAVTNSGAPEAPSGGLYSGRQVVTTAGTAVPLSATKERCENITIIAESDNSGIISVGDASVVAAEGSQRGAILTPLGSLSVKVGDLSKIYIDATVSGDGVSIAYER